MKKIKKEVVKSYNALSTASRIIIKYGLLLSFTVMIAAIYLYILFHDDVSNWAMVRIADELTESSLGTCLATFVSVIMTEAVIKKYL